MFLGGCFFCVCFLYFAHPVLPLCFEAAFWALEDPNYGNILTPRGSKSMLSPRRRAIFHKIIIFNKSRSQGGGGRFWGSLLGVLFWHFCVYVSALFSTPFLSPPGTLPKKHPNDIFTQNPKGRRHEGRHLTRCGLQVKRPLLRKGVLFPR